MPGSIPAPDPPLVISSASATVDGQSQTVLTDTFGMTLYYFAPDKGGGRLTCTRECLANWPPLRLPARTSRAVGGSGVTGNFTTLPNADLGQETVLYNNWPLYYSTKDTKAGDVNGHNVDGKWFVAIPSLAASS